MKNSLLTIAFVLACPAIPVVRGQNYERIDVNDQGVPGNGFVTAGAMSDDARFVVFSSTATNLGPVDLPGFPNLFVRDRVLGTTVPISLGFLPGILDPNVCVSGDGNRIGFSLGSISGGTNPHGYYVYDRASHVQYGVSVPGSPWVSDLHLSYDGRFAAVTASPPLGASPRAYRFEIDTGSVLLCSVNLDGTPAPGFAKDIDDDGTHLLFHSFSDQIVPGDSNGFEEPFLYDIPGHVYLRVAHGQGGAQPNAHVSASSLSGNGRYVGFHSGATNLDASPSSAQGNVLVYVHDARLQTTQLVSQSTQGSTFTSTSQLGKVALDGTSVTFASFHPVSATDNATSIDVYFRDTEHGITIPVSPGSPTGAAGAPLLDISADGRNILFRSSQAGIPGQPAGGMLLAKFGPPCSSANYCASLPSSTGAAATISAQGDASRTLNNLVIAGVGMPNNANALLVSGATPVDPGAPFGNGLLCIGGGMIRHGIHVANGGVILDAQNVNGPEYTAVSPGDTRYYQIFFRDPPAGGAMFNTTDAVSVTFCW